MSRRRRQKTWSRRALGYWVGVSVGLGAVACARNQGPAITQEADGYQSPEAPVVATSAGAAADSWPQAQGIEPPMQPQPEPQSRGGSSAGPTVGEKKAASGSGAVSPPKPPAANAPARSKAAQKPRSVIADESESAPGALPPADGATELADSIARLDTTWFQFEQAISLATPDCPKAERFRKTVCTLAERICTLEQSLPTTTQRRCGDSTRRCQDAARRYGDKCDN